MPVRGHEILLETKTLVLRDLRAMGQAVPYSSCQSNNGTGSRPVKSASVMLTRTMPNLRQSVLDEMERRKMTTYALVKALRGKRENGGDVPSQTVYEFLRGETHINSADLGLICDALGLELRRKR